MRLCQGCPATIPDEFLLWEDEPNKKLYFKCPDCYKTNTYRHQAIRGSRWYNAKGKWFHEEAVEFQGLIIVRTK